LPFPFIINLHKSKCLFSPYCEMVTDMIILAQRFLNGLGKWRAGVSDSTVGCYI
jgi:hypothetical protein